MNFKQICRNSKLVTIHTSLKKKDAQALANVLTEQDTPLILFSAIDTRDIKFKKILVSEYTLFVITSRMFKSSLVEVITMNSIHDIHEKKGWFSSKLTLDTINGQIIFKSVDKKVVSKLTAIWRGEITTPPQNKRTFIETIVKWGLAILISIFIVKNVPQPENTAKLGNSNFSAVYTVVEENNLTLFGVPRFERVIYVPLGLNNETLSLNMRDAAWKLQKEKNAVAVVIFAYREDDIRRDGGYSAGKCTIAPNGKWADAMEVRTPSNLQEEVIISEAYRDNTTIRPNGNL